MGARMDAVKNNLEDQKHARLKADQKRNRAFVEKQMKMNHEALLEPGVMVGMSELEMKLNRKKVQAASQQAADLERRRRREVESILRRAGKNRVLPAAS